MYSSNMKQGLYNPCMLRFDAGFVTLVATLCVPLNVYIYVVYVTKCMLDSICYVVYVV